MTCAPGFFTPTLFFAGLLVLANAATARAEEAAAPVPPSLITPDQVDTRIGPLEFKDGAPSAATAGKLYDNLDFTHAYDAFVNTFQGVNMAAIHEGFQSVGVKDNEIMVFSKLMDASSLFLTANADTVYFLGMIDLSNGPMVLETPPKALGTLDDFWWRWVIDFGAPGPDRGQGGKYLILPPGYDGPVPEGGYYIARSRTTRVAILGRSFLENNDPKPTVDLIKSATKIYPYEVGGVGTSVAEFLGGGVKLGKISEPPATVFHEGSGLSFNTVPPGDYHAFELLNKVVQQEPATALDPELMGPLAAIGIVKGKPFAPDDRMKKILTEAAALANATARTLFMNPRDPEWFYYPNSAWMNFLFISGSEFETPIPMVTKEGVKPFPPTGYRTLECAHGVFLRRHRHHAGDGHAAAGHRLAVSVRVGGCRQEVLRRRQDLQGDAAAKDIPEAKFWSFTLYDNQTRSMLDTPQRYPRAGSQSYPSPAAEAAADGSTTIWFAPEQPEGVKRGNWIQTDARQGLVHDPAAL